MITAMYTRAAVGIPYIHSFPKDRTRDLKRPHQSRTQIQTSDVDFTSVHDQGPQSIYTTVHLRFIAPLDDILFESEPERLNLRRPIVTRRPPRHQHCGDLRVGDFGGVAVLLDGELPIWGEI